MEMEQQIHQAEPSIKTQQLVRSQFFREQGIHLRAGIRQQAEAARYQKAQLLQET